MPKITPNHNPARSVPSRSNRFTPRKRAIKSSTGSAPSERIRPCTSGGMSGSASLTATWLKPQLTHNSRIKAMARGGSEPSVEVDFSDFMISRGWRLVALLSILAVRADAGDFDDRQFRRKAGCARRRVEALGDGRRRHFADQAA